MILRVVASIAVVLSAMSCSPATDALIASRSAGRSTARLVLAPMLSESATRAYGMLAAMGLEVTSVRIMLANLSGTVALDTVIAFPAGTDNLSVDLPINIPGREQEFNATVQLRDASGAVQFASTQRVTARDVSLPSSPAPAFTLVYVGPGYNAKLMTVTPSDATVFPGATQQLVATATDPAGAPVSDLLVSWTSSDTSIAKLTATGNVSATVSARGPRGTVTFTARTPTGVAGTATLTVRPQATRLVVISGSGQTGVALSTLATPFVVEVQATDGGRVAGALVAFRAVTAGGDVASASVTTDSAGRARTSLKLGREVSSYTFEATSGTLSPVTVNASATPAAIGVATQLIPLTPLPSSFKVGVAPTQQFSAQLADANGYYVRQSGVTLTATLVVTPGGVTTSVTSQSDAQGVLTVSIPAFTTAGTVLITLTSPDLKNLPYGTFTITP